MNKISNKLCSNIPRERDDESDDGYETPPSPLSMKYNKLFSHLDNLNNRSVSLKNAEEFRGFTPRLDGPRDFTNSKYCRPYKTIESKAIHRILRGRPSPTNSMQQTRKNNLTQERTLNNFDQIKIQKGPRQGMATPAGSAVTSPN
jgi:hypothetical protein